MFRPVLTVENGRQYYKMFLKEFCNSLVRKPLTDLEKEKIHAEWIEIHSEEDLYYVACDWDVPIVVLKRYR